MDKIGFSQLSIASYNRSGYWSDPDMLEIGNGRVNANEYRTHMSLWSILSAPLIAGNDLHSTSDKTKSILMNEKAIAIDQNLAARPVQTLSSDGKIEAPWRHMAKGSIIVGNRGSDPVLTGFKWSVLSGKLAGKKWSARDLWKHETVPVAGDTCAITVAPYGVVSLKVCIAY